MSRLRRHACSVLVLVLLSAACSEPTGGGGDAAPDTSTTLSTIPGSLHDTVPPPVGDPAVPPSSITTSAGTPSPEGSTPSRRTTTTSRGNPGKSSDTTTSTTLPPGLPPEKCPEPKTCRRYAFNGGTPARWRTGADGKATISYWINPSAAQGISPEDIEGAIQAAFDTWERAAPTLGFVYMGRTTRQATPGDGVNVIAFNGPTIENTTVTGSKEDYVTEFDMLYRAGGWVWATCEQRDDSCTPYATTPDPVTGVYQVDLQAVATHAAGHALWLTDMVNNELDRELTMYPGDGEDLKGSRHWSTLALGDVLGVRALYPCSCPLPPIYDP